MPDSASLIALAERCEAASGPDERLELSVTDALFGWHPPAGTGGLVVRAMRGSLDAAVALCERLLPGVVIRADIWPTHSEISVDHLGAKPSSAATPALALTAAVLRALAVTQESST